jgi:hypothetical protein
MATKHEIVVILDKIKGMFGERFTINADIIQAWQRAFERVAARFVDDALQAHLENSRLVPQLADIRLEALKISGGRFTKPSNFSDPYGISEAIKAQNEREDMVYIETGDHAGMWVKKNDAIKVKNKWRMKIDVILEVFPEHEWNQELLSILDLQKVEQVSFSELMKRKEWVAEYREKRDGFALIARDTLEARSGGY